MKRIFKLLVYVLALSMVLNSVSSYAVELNSSTSSPTQRYAYLVFVSAAVTISSSGSAKCAASAKVSSGYSNYSVSITATLQKQTSSGWSSVKTWYNSGEPSCFLEVYRYVNSGYNYRVRSIATVYSPSGVSVESTTIYSTTVFY